MVKRFKANPVASTIVAVVTILAVYGMKCSFELGRAAERQHIQGGK